MEGIKQDWLGQLGGQCCPATCFPRGSHKSPFAFWVLKCTQWLSAATQKSLSLLVPQNRKSIFIALVISLFAFQKTQKCRKCTGGNSPPSRRTLLSALTLPSLRTSSNDVMVLNSKCSLKDSPITQQPVVL